MWWLTYRRSGRASGVVLMEVTSLVQARMQASLEVVDAGAELAEGHELGAARGALVPVEQVGSMLTIEEARQVLEGLSWAEVFFGKTQACTTVALRCSLPVALSFLYVRPVRVALCISRGGGCRQPIHSVQ
jgi:hypothetical protein